MKTLFNTTYMRIAKRIVMVVAMALVVGNVWGAYNLTQVTSVSAGNKYVLVEDGRAITNSVSNGYLSFTDEYNSTNLIGSEAYVWELETTTGGFFLKNSSLASNQYLRNTQTNGANLGFGASSATQNVWSFSFKSGTATISVTADNSTVRYIGYYATNGYKAYASPANSYPHLFTVYRLDFVCDKIVTLSKGTQTNATISSFSKTSVTTCSSTAADRNVTITVAAATGYKFVSGARLTYTGDGTAEYVSGPTGSGPYTWVYRFSQNDNGSGTFSVTSATAKSATLSFNQNGGEGGQSENKTATYGQAMPTPIATPTKFGHIFGGYYDGEGGTGNKYYNADGTSAGNWDKNTESTTTLYAKWTEKDLTNYRTMCESVYDIVLDDNNGGSNNGSARVEASRNTLSAIEAPTRTGYEVEGYYTDDACTAANKIATNEGALLPNVSTWTNESSQWVKGGDATFYTKWNAIEYTISYEGLEGASNSNPTSYTVATPTITLAAPGSREGYTFTGWTCGGDAITQIALGTTGNKTITATWSLNSHTLAVSAEENVTISATPASASTIAEGSNASVNYGKTVTLNGEPDEHFAMTWKVYKTGNESTVVSVRFSN